MRSLVVCPNWVGDLVMAAPVIRALADAGRQVVALVKPGLRPLAGLLSGISTTLDRLPVDRGTIVKSILAGQASEIASFQSALSFGVRTRLS